MPTMEIPRDEWSLFFDSFSLRHRGWLVSLDVKDNPVFKRPEANELPLEGISADVKAAENVISISVGHEGYDRLSHAVKEPTTVRLEQTADGYDKAIEIDSHSGKTYLRLRSPMASGAIDGYFEPDGELLTD